MTDTRDLTGRVALVTGGASGIGAAVVRRLAARGATTVAVDIDAAGAGAVADEVGGHALRVDVADAAAVTDMVAEVEGRHGRLDIVFLNAGTIGGQVGVVDLDLARYRAVMGVNLDQIVYGTCAAVPALRRAGGGTVVATSSLAGLVGLASDPIYTLTKHAVVGYIRAAGLALAGDGIRVCALCPGFADTPLLADVRAEFGDFPLLTADDVATAFEDVLAAGEPGQVWIVQPGLEAQAYRFRGIPGPVGAGLPPVLPDGVS